MLRTIFHLLTLLGMALVGLHTDGRRTCAAETTALSDTDWLADAQARIREHRQADATIMVVDGDGQPAAGVEVLVEQTRHEFLFGCNIFAFSSFPVDEDTAAYRDRFADLFNFATLPFYWPTYERQRGQPRHAETRRVAEWCRSHGITAKGHPLAWNFADPRWLPADPDEIRKLQLARIEDCVSEFRGLIDTWDVVNEATHFERDEFWRRAPRMTGMWEHTGRLELVSQCFQTARSANPDATLLINDYRTDPAYAKLLRDLTTKMGIRPFDVVGLQSHMHGGVWTNAKLWETCERFHTFDVPLHFTELTVLSGQAGWERAREGGQWPSTPEGEQRQATEVVRIYTILFSHPAVAAITWWDLCDRHAWQRAPAGLLRKDLSAKPAYTQLHDLIKNRWWTRTRLQTDKAGQATFRGFRGDYRVQVRWSDGSLQGGTMQLTRTGANSLRLQLGKTP